VEIQINPDKLSQHATITVMTRPYSRFTTSRANTPTHTQNHPTSSHRETQGAVSHPTQQNYAEGERKRTSYFRSQSGSRQALVATWLNQDPNLAVFAAQAQQDNALRHDCLAVFAQAGLVSSARNASQRASLNDLPIQASLRGATLILITGITALANKINHLSPRLCAGLVQRGWQVNAIRVKVQPQWATTHTPKKQAKLGQIGLQSWESSLAGIHDPALAEAIQRLLNHHKHKK
jgi:hypothetical protein